MLNFLYCIRKQTIIDLVDFKIRHCNKFSFNLLVNNVTHILARVDVNTNRIKITHSLHCVAEAHVPQCVLLDLKGAAHCGWQQYDKTGTARVFGLWVGGILDWWGDDCRERLVSDSTSSASNFKIFDYSGMWGQSRIQWIHRIEKFTHRKYVWHKA